MKSNNKQPHKVSHPKDNAEQFLPGKETSIYTIKEIIIDGIKSIEDIYIQKNRGRITVVFLLGLTGWIISLQASSVVISL